MDGSNEIKSTGMLFKCISKRIVSIINKDLEVYGITLMQNEILHYIYFQEKKQTINQKDIEKFFKSTNPTITGILNRLQSKGLVNREPSKEDARYKIIKLTDAGRAIVEEAHQVRANQMEHRLTKNLTPDEVNELNSLLRKVLDGLEEKN